MTGPRDDMPTPDHPRDVGAIWRDQPTETPPMTLERIHARGFQDRIRRRNMIEYVACAVVVVVFSGYVVWIPYPVLKLACLLIALAAPYVGWQLWRRASARSAPTLDALGFHRAELVRQHEALTKAWAWYLAPFAPGLGLFIGAVLAQPGPARQGGLMLLGFTAVYGVIWVWINRAARRRLKAAIAEIDALRDG